MYRYCLLALIGIYQVLSYPEDDFYQSIGCKAVFEESNKERPIKYDCSEIKKTSESQCFLNKKFYNVGDIIPDEDTNNPCKINCRCSKFGDSSTIACAQIDCPLFYRSLGKGCLYSYESSCCPEKIICKSDTSLATCTHKGETYIEGQSFDGDICTNCICRKGFTGKLEKPFCNKKNCTSDEKYYNAVVNKCAPIYLKESCCPLSFSCAKGSEILLKQELKEKTEHVCEFGDKIINIGQTVEVQVPVKAQCECVIPPLVTCKSDVKYNDFMNQLYG